MVTSNRPTIASLFTNPQAPMPWGRKVWLLRGGYEEAMGLQ